MVAAHAFNPTTREVEAGRSLCVSTDRIVTQKNPVFKRNVTLHNKCVKPVAN